MSILLALSHWRLTMLRSSVPSAGCKGAGRRARTSGSSILPSRGSSSRLPSFRSEVCEWQALRMRAMVAPAGAAAADVEPVAAAPSQPAAAAPAVAGDDDVAALDIRVGLITEAVVHPDADSLYVEQIDVGEPQPRTIVSGLVGYVPLQEMQARKVLVLCNLKARNMRGVKSHGMVLCASNASHDVVQPLAPPPDAAVGERVWFGAESSSQPEPLPENRLQKKKVWEALQPLLTTNEACVAQFQKRPMLTKSGPVRVASLANASIS